MKKICFLLALTLLLTSCSKPTPQTADFNIVTSFYPVMLISKAVTDGADGIGITNLADAGTGCLHNYSLSTNDMKTLENADVLVINGLGMEPFIEKITLSLPSLKIIDLSENVGNEENEHLWLSPQLAASMASYLARALGELTAEHEALYTENANEFARQMYGIHSKIQMALQEADINNIAILHDSLFYLERDYDLNAKVKADGGHEGNTSAKELREVIDMINESGVKVVFGDEQYSKSSAKTISSETGAKFYELDSIVTGKASDTAEEFYTRMNNNFEILKEALINTAE